MMTTTPSRRPAARWALPVEHHPAVQVDVLIPTRNRPAELAVTLAGLAAQNDPPFHVVISDQSDDDQAVDAPAVTAMIRVLRAQGREVQVHRHLPRRGMAEQRQFLFEHSSARQLLYLDDDVWLEPGSISLLSTALDRLGCGFVGSAVQGLSYLDDDRPDERAGFEAWHAGRVEPERVRRGTPAHDRWRLHNAANALHLSAALGLAPGQWTAYKIAWVGGCVLYRRDALEATGAYDFWPQLPPEHSGEDVAAQWRVMQRFGGAGILPTGAVHLESPTTVPDRHVDAPDVVFEHDDEHHPLPADSGREPIRKGR
jgi:GT2 family glycosyltransferase